jgi:hypothetical protein
MCLVFSGLADDDLPARTMLSQSANHYQQFLDDVGHGDDQGQLTSSDMARILRENFEKPTVKALLAELRGCLENFSTIPAHWCSPLPLF